MVTTQPKRSLLPDTASPLAELKELANKADLNSPTVDSLTRHEHYLWARNVLQTYSADEEVRIQFEITELPNRDRQNLELRATRRTLASRFHLSTEEAEKLVTERRKLRFHERAQLFKVLHSHSGIAWLDLGEILFARIKIDDNSPEREDNPHAYVSFPDERNRSQRIVETIDILGSVRNNPACVGHPVIAFAIHHWQRVIQSGKLFKRDDNLCGKLDVEIAKRNLEAMGNALTKGSTTNTYSKELAFFLSVQRLNLEASPLKAAWERLSLPHVGKLIDKAACVSAVGSHLRDREQTEQKQAEQNPYPVDEAERNQTKWMDCSGVSIKEVIEFLKSDDGQQFVGCDENGESLRERWVFFQNTFLAWCSTDLKHGSVQQYMAIGKKESESIDPNEIYQPSLLLPTTDVIGTLFYVLTTPLLRACVPAIAR